MVSQEARGLDPKDWVVPADEVAIPGQAHWWLFKPIKAASYRRYDDWAEKLAAELARLLRLPSARVELAHGAVDEGIISANVTPDGWSLESGDTILSDFDGYVSCASEPRPKNRVGHNLKNIGSLLRTCSGPPNGEYADWAGMDVFAGYLVFDAWIANTDRHAINWGVLTCDGDGRRALAPSFDHGSALASGTQDDRLSAITPEYYALRGLATRFEDGAKLTLVDLALDAVHRTGGDAGVWIERLSSIQSDAIEGVLGAIPAMSDVRRRFLCNLLLINQRRLTS